MRYVYHVECGLILTESLHSNIALWSGGTCNSFTRYHAFTVYHIRTISIDLCDDLVCWITEYRAPFWCWFVNAHDSEAHATLHYHSHSWWSRIRCVLRCLSGRPMSFWGYFRQMPIPWLEVAPVAPEVKAYFSVFQVFIQSELAWAVHIVRLHCVPSAVSLYNTLI